MRIKDYKKYINENNILDIHDILLMFFEDNNIRKYKDIDDREENTNDNAYQFSSSSNGIEGYIDYVDLHIKIYYNQVENRIRKLGYNVSSYESVSDVWDIIDGKHNMLDYKMYTIHFKISY